MESGPIDLLHVAAHASFHNLNPMFSSIVAAEDRILALDLARSPLRVDTVILSACDTGAMSLENRFEANGLTRAFLARGAKRVVATQWPLDDVAAFEFMNAMYYNVLDGISLSLALPSARQAVRQKFAHPYYWGAPLLFRGYDL